MKRASWLVGAVVFGVSVVALAAGPTPGKFSIKNMYFAGTGCPAQSVQGMISADGSVFTATFEKFYALAGPNYSRLDRRKFCNLTVDLNIPKNFSFSILRLNTLGYVDLDEDTSAKSNVMVRFAGDSQDKARSFANDFYGPASEDFFVSSEIPLLNGVWSPCGGGIPMNISTSISATASGAAQAIIGIDQQDGKLEYQFGIAWRKCGDIAPEPEPEPTLSARDMRWSYTGPISGMTCVQVKEPSDPHGWNDNYLCTYGNFGLKWSYAGPISGMVCTQIQEGADSHTWNDNYLCAPNDFNFMWSSAGPIAGAACLQWQEPADPDTWNDNFLCTDY